MYKLYTATGSVGSVKFTAHTAEEQLLIKKVRIWFVEKI